jgi:hypothetical protein
MNLEVRDYVSPYRSPSVQTITRLRPGDTRIQEPEGKVSVANRLEFRPRAAGKKSVLT